MEFCRDSLYRARFFQWFWRRNTKANQFSFLHLSHSSSPIYFHCIQTKKLVTIYCFVICSRKDDVVYDIICSTFILIRSLGVDGVMLRLGLLFWSSIDRLSLLLSSFSWLGVTATPIFTSAIKRLALSRKCCCLSSSFCVYKICYINVHNYISSRNARLIGNSLNKK